MQEISTSTVQCYNYHCHSFYSLILQFPFHWTAWKHALMDPAQGGRSPAATIPSLPHDHLSSTYNDRYSTLLIIQLKGLKNVELAIKIMK